MRNKRHKQTLWKSDIKHHLQSKTKTKPPVTLKITEFCLELKELRLEIVPETHATYSSLCSKYWFVFSLFLMVAFKFQWSLKYQLMNICNQYSVQNQAFETSTCEFLFYFALSKCNCFRWNFTRIFVAFRGTRINEHNVATSKCLIIISGNNLHVNSEIPFDCKQCI